MSINMVNMFSSAYKSIESKTQDQPGSNDLSFGNLMTEQLNRLNELQIEADESVRSLALGDAENVHDVMIKAEEAKMALELAVQVRNKLVESYQEVMKLQL